MEQLDQLKVMRDEARQRIAATADYKLATSLEALIADLEEMLGVSNKSDEEETTEDSGDEEPARSQDTADESTDANPIAAAFADFQTSDKEVADAAAEIEAAAEREAERESGHEEEVIEKLESELADDIASGLNGSGTGHEEAHAFDETTSEVSQDHQPTESEEEAPIGVEDDFQQALEDLARSTATAPYDADADESSDDETSQPDEISAEELSEDEAIVRAMQALDEDLANVDLDVEAGDSKEKAG